MKMRPRKDLAWRRIAGELFIVDAAGSRLHELNGTAALAWEGLAAGRDQAAVARAIAGEYEVGPEEAAADVAAFAAELAAAGLLEKAEK
jgi:hypothetical protein